MGMTARLFAAAVWTAVAAGFLLPPGLSSVDNLPNTLSKARTVQFPCPECSPIPVQAGVAGDFDDDTDWQPRTNAILIDVRTTADLQHLEIAGEVVYPWDTQSLEDTRRPHATQISTTTGAELPIEITSLGMRFPDPEPASDDGDLSTSFEYQVLALAEQDMPNMPVITIDLLQMKNGELYILDVRTEAGVESEDDDPASFYSKSLPSPPPPAPECSNILCTMRNFMHGRLGSIGKPACAGRKSRVHNVGVEDSKAEAHAHPHSFHHDHHHHPPPPPSLGHIHLPPPPPSPAHDHHHHHHPHGGPHAWGPPGEHGRHGHFFLHVAIGSIMTTVIPILAGIIVGLLISYIALGIARLAGCVYHNTFRGQRSEDEDLEKLLSKEGEAECPPAYEHAPAYVEVEAAESK